MRLEDVGALFGDSVEPVAVDEKKLYGDNEGGRESTKNSGQEQVENLKYKAWSQSQHDRLQWRSI